MWFVLILLMSTILVSCSDPITPIQNDLISRTTEEIDEGEKPSETDSSTNLEEVIKTETPDRKDRLGEPNLPGGLERVKPTAGNPVIGEVPGEILADIITDLVGRTETARDSIKVLRAEAVVWNDGSLGCPQPGEYYTQAQVPGYWVVLDAGGDVFDYRVTENGYFTLCEGPGLVQPPPGALKE